MIIIRESSLKFRRKAHKQLLRRDFAYQRSGAIVVLAFFFVRRQRRNPVYSVSLEVNYVGFRSLRVIIQRWNMRSARLFLSAWPYRYWTRAEYNACFQHLIKIMCLTGGRSATQTLILKIISVKYYKNFNINWRIQLVIC